MIIRDYQIADAAAVGVLIKETYSKYNLDFLAPEDLEPFLGPFAHAGEDDPDRVGAIHAVIQSEMVYVAEIDRCIAGVLRGRMERLASRFVGQVFHRQGIATALVSRFEEKHHRNGGRVIRLASSLYAVPFYLKLGYKKSTGQRRGWSFEGWGLPVQPMKKLF